MSIVFIAAKRPLLNKLAGVSLILFALFATVLAGSRDAEAATGRKPGHVYLLRGLLNVFSLGMDQLAYKIEAVGITATVHNHTAWSGLADDMIANYRSGKREPIILIGHSAGADATISIARKLQQANVPVALIANFDPVSPDPVPPNVKQIVNYYVPAGWGAAVAADARFKGSLANINENGQANHFSIDKSDALHAKTIALILRAVGNGGPRRGPAKPKPAQVSAAPAE
ncbi:MAG: hypothetical protein JWR89_3362 [Tardiphaga sp.]|jgi:pimeloyl-ACP methyl ester carboxylesterase|uniref:hypothetical protein n=1 Tax=Tardiphaga sp. TaxID=1926292 RepID=UPI002635EDB6|nr:hypothetical protein [Tardiphaga sp.]MDB5503460.1 hypothetical protein [Tardiphaga sp.]